MFTNQRGGPDGAPYNQGQDMTNPPIAQTSFACRSLTTEEVRQAVKRLAEMYASTHTYYEESRLDGRRKYRFGLRDLPMHHGVHDILVTPFNGKDFEWFTDGQEGHWALAVRSRRCVEDMAQPLPDADNDRLIGLVIEIAGRLKEIIDGVAT